MLDEGNEEGLKEKYDDLKKKFVIAIKEKEKILQTQLQETAKFKAN